MPMRPNSISSSHSAPPSDDDYSSSDESESSQRTQESTARLNAQADSIFDDLPTRRGSNPPRHTNLTHRRASTLLGIYENRANASAITQAQYMEAASYLQRLSVTPEAEVISDLQPTLTPEQQALIESRFPTNLYQHHLRMDGQIEITSYTGQGSMLYDPDTSQFSPLHDVDQSLRPR